MSMQLTTFREGKLGCKSPLNVLVKHFLTNMQWLNISAVKI